MPKTPPEILERPVPLNYLITPDGQARIILADGVEWVLGPAEHARRFNAESVKTFFARYQKAGGDPQRLQVLLEGLLQVTVPKPPTQEALKELVRRASETLDELLRLPGNLPGHKAREVFKSAAERLHRFDDHAQEEYLAQFKWREPPMFAVEIPARVIPGPLIRSDFRGGSASLVLSRPAGDRPPQIPFAPPINAPGRGRRRGSPTGLILGVLAKECKRRHLRAPWWPDILEVCKAIAPETFPPKTATVEHLRKRVEGVPDDQITDLFHRLFSAD